VTLFLKNQGIIPWEQKTRILKIEACSDVCVIRLPKKIQDHYFCSNGQSNTQNVSDAGFNLNFSEKFEFLKKQPYLTELSESDVFNLSKISQIEKFHLRSCLYDISNFFILIILIF
jgi:hypothetical protein